MAIIRNEISIRDVKYMHTYSDKQFYIKRENVLYADAIDPIEFANERIYIETNIPIEEEEVIEDVEQ